MIKKEQATKKLLNQAQKLLIQDMISELQSEGELILRGFGTLRLLPRRKGELYGKGKFGKFKYSKRVKFIPSEHLKEKVCR